MINKSDVRANNLYEWSLQHKQYFHIEAITGDASFRRYFRLHSSEGTDIGVDAPPDTENNHAFVAVAQAFLKQGLSVPEVFKVNYEQGFLLLSDLGRIKLLDVLQVDNVDQHYSTAFEHLIKLQACKDFLNWSLPLYDHHTLLQELSHFHNWFLMRHLGLTLSDHEMSMLTQIYELLIASASAQPAVCVHRDYHSRNMMLLPNNEIALIDFQDAVKGPITYDLVSLLRDCYINWPSEKIYQWVEQFWCMLPNEQQVAMLSLENFIKFFDLMGLQRHLKVLGIFSRLFYRDNKAMYLQDIPRILDYVLFVCEKYQECSPLKNFLIDKVITHESNDISSWARQSNAPFDR